MGYLNVPILWSIIFLKILYNTDMTDTPNNQSINLKTEESTAIEKEEGTVKDYKSISMVYSN